ncbi:MAG: Uma2 family endonuclease [Deferrisomatales bacterium]|nr:Uma2 family endonuclease [Deferrisomatales bacterium]
MSQPAKRRASYEDLYTIPENATGEILDGELVVTPRPSPEHALAASRLGGRILPTYDFGHGGGPGGWIILDEPEVLFAGRGEPLVPDLAGWRKERFRRSREHNWIDVIPDWVCEVLSPGSAKKDRFTKMDIYRESPEVHHVWLVDPYHKTLEVFGRQESGAWITASFFAGNDRVRAEPFPEAEFDLAGLWLE